MKDNNILVSIRCVTYNQENYIDKCLEGIVKQKTNFRFEAYVHDDASTDKTSDVVEKYAKNFPNIIKPYIEKNNIYSKKDGSFKRTTWNPDYLTGKYLALCEGDDYWTDPYKLQKQVDFLESHPEYGMCFTNFSILRENGQMEESVLGKNGKPYEFKNIGEWIKSASYVGPMTWLIRKNLWLSHPDISSVDGTFVYFAHYLANSKVYCLEDENTAVYRIVPESASHTKSLTRHWNYHKGLHETQFLLIDLYKDKIPEPEKLKEEINKQYYSNVVFFIMEDDVEELNKARKYAQESWPRNKKIMLELGKYKWGRAIIRKLFLLHEYHKHGMVK